MQGKNDVHAFPRGIDRGQNEVQLGAAEAEEGNFVVACVQR
jgi:hypothetical protein